MASESEASPRRARAQALFATGSEAAHKSNYDYAIQMYQEACKLVPEELRYRQALRGVERRKFGNEPSKVGRLVGAHNQPIRLRAKSELARKNPAQALQTCEEAFVRNPWDVSASMIAAEAAEQLGLKPLAMWLLESVYGPAGDDVHFLRQAAHAYELNEEWQKAIGCWEKVRRLQPADEIAARQINALSASATITRSGLGAAIARGGAEAAEAAAALEAEAEELKKPALTPEQRWQKEIQERPDNPRPHLEWADSLIAQGRLDEAEKVLARALKAIPQDAALLRAHADVQVGRLKRAGDAWARRARENPGDAEARAKARQLAEMLRDYELKEYRRRVALDPDDPALRYQLGLRLAAAGRHDEAIAEFQHLRHDPRLKVQALLQLSLSFEANGVLKLAERSLQDALKAAEPDDPETLKALHYRLGRVCEATGDLKKAEDHYNEVAALDYGYEDVAGRLRAINRPAEG